MLLSVLDILNNKTNGDIVSVKAKIISKSTPDSVYSPTMKKFLKSDLVADSSSAIPVTIWEDKIVSYIVQIRTKKDHDNYR